MNKLMLIIDAKGFLIESMAVIFQLYKPLSIIFRWIQRYIHKSYKNRKYSINVSFSLKHKGFYTEVKRNIYIEATLMYIRLL